MGGVMTEAYWTVGPEQGQIRRTPLDPPGPGDVQVRTLYSAISRGTETLVHRHAVPEPVRALMRAPFQEGDLPGPVKYGYLSVGVVEEGPGELVGRRVFCLHPHQTRFVVPATAVVVVPDDVPSERALLAGAVETAVNALWDAAPRLGDRVAVVGLGMIGASVATLLTGFPLERLQVVDTDPGRRELADRLGLELVTPDGAAGDCDVVVHASASEAGLATALRLAGEEAEVVELSWYGDRPVTVHLGSDFHSRRLRVRASQVSTVSPHRAPRRDHVGRMRVALRAAATQTLDHLLAGPTRFEDLPDLMDRLASGEPGLCHVIRYGT